MNKKLNKVPSAGTKADSEQKDEDMQVCPAIAKPNVVCSQMSVSLFCEIRNEILSLGFNEVTFDDKETEFLIEDGFSKSGYYKVSLFKDDMSCPVFIRSHKSESNYGEIVAGYHLIKRGDFTELLARLVGWFKFIDKVSDCFKIIAK